MSLFVLSLVLFSAFMHALWNLFVKKSHDHLLTMASLHIVSGVIGMTTVPFLQIPKPESWPYILASVILHLGYQLSLVKAYAHGDLGQVYPIARGISPLLLILVSSLWIGEELSTNIIFAIILITLGIFIIIFNGRKILSHSFRPIFYAILTGFFIASYTIADGLGVRYSGNSISYVMWLMTLEFWPLLLVTIFRRKNLIVSFFKQKWIFAVLGGIFSITSYGIVVWAMQHSQIALVAALRESSVVIAALLSIIILKEKTTYKHFFAVLMVCLGVMLSRI